MQLNPPTTLPELIFELGRLQVFHYPTADDIAKNLSPKDVFWQDKISRHTYGPFPSIYIAMTHYAWVVASQKKDKKLSEKPDADMIYVDFTTKKKIIYELPEES